MKKSVLALILAIAISACMSPATTSSDRNLGNEAIVVKYTDAIINGRVDEMSGFLTDDFKSYGPAVSDSSTRDEEIQGWRNSWDSLYTSISFDRYGMLSTHNDEGRVAGDWVFDWGLVTLNYKTGKTPVTFWFHGIYRMRDGKIEFSRAMYDVNDVLVQRGFTLTPPPSM